MSTADTSSIRPTAAPSSVIVPSPEPSSPAPTTPPPAESSDTGGGTTAPPGEDPTTAPPAVTSDPGAGDGGGAVPSSDGGVVPTTNPDGSVPSAGVTNNPAPGGGSDAVVPTSNGGGAVGSGGAGVGTAGPTGTAGQSASPSQWTTVFTTITGADGTIQTSAIVSQLPSGGGKSSTNVGAIVGGVVGGVGGAIVLAILLWFFMRKRKNYRDDFDDLMFDPSRAQNHAPVDLGDDEGMPTIDPYGYNSGAGVASTATTPMSPEMTQAHGGPHTGYAPVSQDYAQTPTSAGFAGRGAGSPVYPSDTNNLYADNSNLYPQPLSPQPTSVGDHSQGTYSTATYSTGDHSAGAYAAAGGAAAATGAAAAPMAAKQREALQESQRFHVQNQTQAYGGPGPSGPSGWSAEPQGVTVHQDGGAWTEADASGPEIPPTYDSIPRGQR